MLIVWMVLSTSLDNLVFICIFLEGFLFALNDSISALFHIENSCFVVFVVDDLLFFFGVVDCLLKSNKLYKIYTKSGIRFV